MRHSERANNQIRNIEIIPHFNPYAEGSCLIKCGNTHVVCTVTVEEKVPSWLKGQEQFSEGAGKVFIFHIVYKQQKQTWS